MSPEKITFKFLLFLDTWIFHVIPDPCPEPYSLAGALSYHLQTRAFKHHTPHRLHLGPSFDKAGGTGRHPGTPPGEIWFKGSDR